MAIRQIQTGRTGVFAQNPATGKWLLRQGAALAGGFLLAGISVLGRPVPVAIGLTAALPFGVPAVCTYIGSALGYLAFWGMDRAIAPAAAGFLTLAGLCLFTDLVPKDRAWFLPWAAAVLYGLIGLLSLLGNGFPLGDTAFLLGQMALLGLCGCRFAAALEGSRGDRLFLGLCALAGTCAIRLPGNVPLGLLLAAGVSFLAAGGSRSLLLAAASGLALDITWQSGASMTAILAFSALLTGQLDRLGRWARAGLYLLCLLAGMVLTGGGESPALLGALGGVGLALCVPPAVLKPYQQDANTLSATRIQAVEQVGDVLLRVGQTLGRTRLEHLHTQSAAVFDRAAEQACRGCSRWYVCWQSRATDTYLCLSKAASGILRRGRAERPDLPPEFIARCADVEGFLSAVNAALDDQLLRRQYQSRLAESRMVVAAQYCTAARLLQRAAEPEPEAAVVPAFTPELGYRAQGVRGGEITGDHGACFTAGEWYYVLLCDGMGTGEEASRESITAIGILRDLICAGLEAQDALETLNGVYILRGDGVFSTIDLLQVSLVTGEGYLLKWGAAPSYLKRADRVEKLGRQTLPPGLGDGSRAQCLSVNLSGGELLVLVSDGADSPRIQRQLDAWLEAPAKELAAQIVASWDEAEDQDDRTAAVVRLRPVQSR